MGDERLTVIFNFKDYSRKNSPSTSTVITMARVLQRCFPERLGVLIITHPPFWMRTIYAVVWPVLSKVTTDRIMLPTSNNDVEAAFRKAITSASSANGDNNDNDDDDNKHQQKEELIGTLLDGSIADVDYTQYTQQRMWQL